MAQRSFIHQGFTDVERDLRPQLLETGCRNSNNVGLCQSSPNRVNIDDINRQYCMQFDPETLNNRLQRLMQLDSFERVSVYDSDQKEAFDRSNQVMVNFFRHCERRTAEARILCSGKNR